MTLMVNMSVCIHDGKCVHLLCPSGDHNFSKRLSELVYFGLVRVSKSICQQMIDTDINAVPVYNTGPLPSALRESEECSE